MWSELFAIGNKPDDEEAEKKLKANFENHCRQAAKAAKDSEILLVVTGAGFSADSGLAVYNDVASVPAYQKRSLDYSEICMPDWLFDEPELFYGFWGQCFNDYRSTEPHEGYHILARWKEEKNDKNAKSSVAQEIQARTIRKVELRRPFDDKITQQNSPYNTEEGQYAKAFFSFTSNVDAHWYDIVEAHEVHDCHGNIETWQCSNKYCEGGIWRAPMEHSFEVCHETMLAPERRSVDAPATASSPPSQSTSVDCAAHIGQTKGTRARKNTLRNMPKGKNETGWHKEAIRPGAEYPGAPSMMSNFPKCGRCREPARPAVLMFRDFNWKRDLAQGERWSLWEESVLDLCERRMEQLDPLRICIVEIGCGLNVPTCRGASERMVLQAKRKGGAVNLVRINPDCPLAADENITECLIPIMARGLEALTQIDNFYRMET